MNTTALIVALLILNALCVIGLDRAPARGITIEPDDETEGLFPVTGPPAGWRKLWRPVCLYGGIFTAAAAAAVPMIAG